MTRSVEKRHKKEVLNMDEEAQSRLTDDYLHVMYGLDAAGFLKMMERERQEAAR